MFSIEAIPCLTALPLQARLGLLFSFSAYLRFLSTASLRVETHWFPLTLGWPLPPDSLTTGSHTSNRAGLGLGWCCFPTPPSDRPKTAAQGRVWFNHLFFPAFLGGSPANSRYAYTAISPALNPRMKISLGRKDPPCRGFLLQVHLIFSSGLLPIFRIPFCEAFSLFTPPQFLRWPLPCFRVSERLEFLPAFA